ncbi:hypothetical protein RDWZM_004330 [Blomia tropicalis]|uniref:Uncharacterized protein n=1 Tax=Blomia tropicalis TaxID=40697 RepID=A0A9Q0MKZ1_BLOTA|nr:hypothetical protein BLOT_011607 [Blomia tropicalis]KAJ6225785.1 hypothetical protein RDWZM_004330 [Blomia tropicalis]
MNIIHHQRFWFILITIILVTISPSFADDADADDNKSNFNWSKMVNKTKSYLSKANYYSSMGMSVFVTLLRTFVYLLSSLIVYQKIYERFTMTKEEAAIDSGLIDQLLNAENEGSQNRIIQKKLQPITQSNRFLTFISSNYYMLIVLIIFLNVSLLIMFISYSQIHLPRLPPQPLLIEERSRLDQSNNGNKTKVKNDNDKENKIERKKRRKKKEMEH